MAISVVQFRKAMQLAGIRASEDYMSLQPAFEAARRSEGRPPGSHEQAVESALVIAESYGVRNKDLKTLETAFARGDDQAVRRLEQMRALTIDTELLQRVSSFVEPVLDSLSTGEVLQALRVIALENFSHYFLEPSKIYPGKVFLTLNDAFKELGVTKKDRKVIRNAPAEEAILNRASWKQSVSEHLQRQKGKVNPEVYEKVRTFLQTA